MKLTILAVAFSIFSCFASNTYSQNTKLTIAENNSTLLNLLRAIEGQSEFKFFYNQSVNVSMAVTVNATQKTIFDILDAVLANTSVKYKVIGQQIALYDKDEMEPFISEQQDRKITGKITNSSGATLPGVSVVAKGTTIGVTTDNDGRFSLSLPKDAKILTLSFIGMETQEIKIGTLTQINVTMAESAIDLEEVSVIGYGVQKKKLVTGATTQVSGTSIEKRLSISPLTALQGQTPGVNITSEGGRPGGNIRVSIRGAGTVGETTPLFIVDGVQTSDINYLNTSDIASIDILKDGASAAIYGSRAANGVILVSTKKGTAGKSQVSFDSYFGLQNPSKKIQVLDGREFMNMRNEMATNSGSSLIFPDETQNNKFLKDVNGGTDWIGLLLAENVPTQNYNISAQGGTENSIYAISLSYTQQGGIVGGTDLSNYERYTFRVNTEHKLYKDILKVGEHFSLSNSANTGGNYPISSAIRMPTIIPNLDPNDPSKFYYNFFPSEGGVNDHMRWSVGLSNPYALMLANNFYLSNTNKIVGDVYLDLKIIDNLVFRTVLGVDFSFARDREYQPLLPNLSGNDNATSRTTRVMQSSMENLSVNIDNTLTYAFKINNSHEFDAMIGTSALKTKGYYLMARNQNLLYEGMDYAWIDNASGTSQGGTMAMSGYPSEDALLSYFGRVSYNYKNTYMLTTTMRSDGSSRFDKEHRRGYFPSISAGWTVSNESFLQNTTSWLNSLKLRGSWGQNGNQNIPPYYYMALVQSNMPYSYGDDGSSEVGAAIYRGGNPSLSWETSQSTDIGLDTRLFGNKLGFTFDWYDKQTRDWLLLANVPLVYGVNAPYINGGDVVNRGVEFAIDYSNRIGNDFSYRIAGNIAFNKNKVVSIPTSSGILHGASSTLYPNSAETTRSQNGYPLGFFWGQTTNGIFQTQDEVNNNKNIDGTVIQPNARPGDIRYVDRNGNGQIDDGDKTMIGDPHPDAIFGLDFSFAYKGFDLYIVTNGVAGNQILQNYVNLTRNQFNFTKDLYDNRWHGEGTSNKYPRFDLQNSNWIQFSDIYLYKGDYLKISNVTLGYDFRRLIKTNMLSQLRLYASVQNLYNFTSYNGMDPEVGTGNNGIDKSEIGRDSGMYPHARTVLLGLNVKF